MSIGVIAKLVRAGVDAALVAEVVEALAAASGVPKLDLAAEKRRARNARYYQKHRPAPSDKTSETSETPSETPSENVLQASENVSTLAPAHTHAFAAPLEVEESKKDISEAKASSPQNEILGAKPSQSNGHDLFGSGPPAKIERCRKAVDEGWMTDVGGMWNELASEINRPQVSTLVDRREAALRRVWKDFRDDYPDPVACFGAAFGKIRGSPFLRGETDRWGGVTFDWVMNLLNFHKIMDGNYEPQAKPARQGSARYGRGH